MVTICYKNQNEECVPVLAQVETVASQLGKNIILKKAESGDNPESMLFDNGCDIMLAHHTTIKQLLVNGTSKVNGQEPAKIVIAFSSGGCAEISPRKFVHERNGTNYRVYGFGIYREVANNVFLPKEEAWQELLSWAIELSNNVAKSDVDIAQIVAKMPEEVRQLIAPPAYPETLVAAYLLLVANKNTNINLNALTEKQWEEAVKQYKDGGGKCEDTSWSAHASDSSEQNTIIDKLATHFSAMAARP